MMEIDNVMLAFVYVDSFGPLQKAQINLRSAIRCFYSDGVLVANKGKGVMVVEDL